MDSTQPAIVPRKDRHESLDVLRGVAILGIFAVNILAFGFPWYALSNPALFSDAFNNGGAFWWSLSTTLFQFKFITLFSVMFGAGLVLFIGEDKPTPRTPLHRRRMFWLFIFGMLHNYLLWYGDILVAYAIAGFLVAGARRWGAALLIVVGILLITLNFGVFALQDFGFGSMPPEMLNEIKQEMWAPPPEKVEEELAVYRSGFFERLPNTAMNAMMAQVMQGLFMMPRTIGLMMIGMALFKIGFLTLRWRSIHYLVLGVVFTAIGAAGSYWSAEHFIAVNFAMIKVFPGQSALYWSSLVQAYGYACLVMFFCTSDGLRLLRAPFAAAGRMALSNYLASTIIAVGVYYGPPGLGKIGSVSFDGLALTVGGVWLFILVWSPIWLALFRYGPFEWLWRSLTYGKAQPLLK